MWRNAVSKLKKFGNQIFKSIMEAKAGDKRTADGSKKLADGEIRADRKRKVALITAYNGKGYHGCQLNGAFRSIEGDLVKALLEIGVIPQEHHDNFPKMSFQRASRTDKGVSAAGNVFSLKMQTNVDNLIDAINEKLPPQIRTIACVRTTKGFNAKNMCGARTYEYILPTYAFAPVEEKGTLDYRTNNDIIERVNEVLEKFLGHHNFHNFTSGVAATDRSACRYIHQFECRLPFVRDGAEFCVLSVKGQSFMLHQIRKMIGLTIAIVRGFTNIDAIQKAWQHEKMDIPKAPGLGLILEKLHYDVYNNKFASDGTRERVDFSMYKDQIEEFKQEYIFSDIIKTEIEECSMMSWLHTLHLHSYGVIGDGFIGRKKYLNQVAKDLQEKQETESTANLSLDSETVADQVNTSSEPKAETQLETDTEVLPETQLEAVPQSISEPNKDNQSDIGTETMTQSSAKTDKDNQSDSVTKIVIQS